MRATTPDTAGETMQIIMIADQMEPLMNQLPSNVQGGVLASLLAKWLAGHVVVGDREATFRIQDRLMRSHFKLIQRLMVTAQAQQERTEKGK